MHRLVRVLVVGVVASTWVNVVSPLLGPANAAAPSYCTVLAKIMADNSVDPFAGDPSFFTKKAESLRASNPPADVKKAVSDFASGLDELAAKLKSMKSKPDIAVIRKQFGAGSKYQQGLVGILRYQSTTCAGFSAPSSTAPAKPTGSAAIPESAAITALAAHLAGNMKAAPVLQSCLVVTTMDLRQDLSKKVDPESKTRIAALALAVRGFDSKVADAIGKASLKEDATWCKHHGFAN